MDKIWIVFLFLFVTIFLLIYVSSIKIHVTFNKEKSNDYINIKIYMLYNLIKINKDIPMVLFESLTEGIKFESDTSTVKGNNKKIKKDRITIEKIEKWKREFYILKKKVKGLYKEIKLFTKRINIDLFNWSSLIGTDDAFQTGTVTGLVWSIKGISLAVIYNYFNVTNKPYVWVEPYYRGLSFNTRLECILRFRVGNVIFTGLRILIKLYRRDGDKGERRTSYSRINENSYGKY